MRRPLFALGYAVAVVAMVFLVFMLAAGAAGFWEAIFCG